MLGDVAAELLEFLVQVLDVGGGLVDGALEAEEPVQDVVDDGLVAVRCLLRERVGLALLFLVLLDLGVDASPAVQRVVLVLDGLFLDLLEPLVLVLVLQGRRDLLDEAGQVPGALAGNLLDVSLEAEEVPGLDQDVLRLERVVVLLRRDNLDRASAGVLGGGSCRVPCY
jgi:hypothetical protein